MICEKCGSVLPDNAVYCGECGTKVIKKKQASPALAQAKAAARKYRITTIILACLCVALGIGWMVTSHDPYRNADNYEKDAVEIQRAGIELTGRYVVGEDVELPEGRYNIYPPDGESYMDVRIYDSEEAAKKRFDKDYNSLAIGSVYSLTRGYKLKAGQIVVIEYDSAFFELVSDEPAQTESTEASAADGAGEADGASAADGTDGANGADGAADETVTEGGAEDE